MAASWTFGARPLKRVIQQKIDNALAGRILSGEVHDGDHVVIDAAGKSFTFQTQRPAAPREPAQPEETDVVEGELVED